MDFQMKQRLVGAIVLVALAVIFIPMLLEGPDRDLMPEMEPLPEPEEQSIGQALERFPAAGEVPGQPERSIVQTDTGPDMDIEQADAVAGDQSASPAEVPLLSEPDIPASDGLETAPLETTEQPTAGRPGAADSQTVESQPLGNWVVQMGSFSSEQNALRLRDRLRKAGFVTQLERVLVKGKTLFRVRVGPYLERAEAEGDQKKLAETLALKGRVLSYP
jgi:DedD protein